MVTSLGEGTSEFKLVFLRLKIDLVSHPVCGGGFQKICTLVCLSLNKVKISGNINVFSGG